MGKKWNIVWALAAGFAAAMLLMGIVIYLGYTAAYRTETEQLTVKLLGLPIYQLTRVGEGYAGQSQGAFMGAVCGICMAAALGIRQGLSHLRRKRG